MESGRALHIHLEHRPVCPFDIEHAPPGLCDLGELSLEEFVGSKFLIAAVTALLTCPSSSRDVAEGAANGSHCSTGNRASLRQEACAGSVESPARAEINTRTIDTNDEKTRRVTRVIQIFSALEVRNTRTRLARFSLFQDGVIDR